MSKEILVSGQVTLTTVNDGIPGQTGKQGNSGKDGKDGTPGKDGKDGVDANLLDWVQQWDSGKTVISSDTVITPKIFAGTRNPNGTITGTAIGRFNLLSRNSAGQFQSELIDGIYGFHDGTRTFAIDNTGSVELGRGDQSIRYDALTGKIVFGKDVSLNWKNDIDDSISKIQRSEINHIRYSTFAQEDTDGILVGGVIKWEIDRETRYNGYNSLKINQSRVKDDLSNNRVWFAATKICNPASFSMWARSEINTNLRIRLGSFGDIHEFPLTPEWSYITVENQQPSSVVVMFAVTNVGYYNVALPMLVEGPNALSWRPSDFDIQVDISLARETADAITKKSEDEGWSTKMTYIDKSGIFTGTLSANTINGIRINANQITAGTISADRIDVATLKSQLITADNIEALTLNVVHGKIGGWSLDADSIYRGTKNNTAAAFTTASGSITIGSNGIRGFKWILESTGAGKLADGNISWDAAGNVTFGASVVLNWNTPINEIKTALGGNNYPKLTYISSTGIYTGTLNAGSINAGTLSVDRIAAGSIKAEKLDASSIKTSIINTAYIEGLTLNFVRGKIGGWTIGEDSIVSVSSYSVGQTPVQIRSASTGSGYIYSGAFKPLGITLSWYQSSNAGHLVFGQIMATGNTVKAGFIGLQMMSWDHQEYFCLSANSTKSGGKETYNRIAGWAFDHQAITKNNVSLGSDGTIANGTKWKLANDGSGSLASGAITWTAAGAVTFSSAVSLNWTKIAHENKIYVRGTGANNNATRIVRVNGVDIVNGMGRGLTLTVLNRSTLALVSTKNYDTHGTAALCDEMSSALMALGSDRIVIITSYDAHNLTQSLNSAIQYCGGSDITLTYRVPYAFIGIPGIGKNNGLVAISGQLATDPYAEISTTVINGIPTGFNIAGKQNTYITGNGVYTGVLSASQVNSVEINASSIKTGILSVDRLAAGSIKAEKLDAATLKSNIINTAYIEGLTLNFVRGKIGGWTIGADNITAGVFTVGANPGIQLRTASSGSGIIYNGAYRPLGLSLTYYQSGNAGHMVFGQVMTNTSTPKAGFYGLQMMNHSGHEFFCMAVNVAKTGGTEYYNRIAGWAFTQTVISKGNVALGADGSITAGNYWKLNNNGSGSIANGNISWTAAGAVTFSTAVSASWTTGINNATDLARCMTFGRMLNRYPEFYYNGAVHYNGTVQYLSNCTRSILPVSGCPNSTGYALRFTATGWHTASDLRIGGPSFGNKSRANAIFLVRIIANIPVGRNIQNHHNAFGGGTQKWLTSQAGTGKWEEYLCKITCGSSGTFSTINYLALFGGTAPTASSPVIWDIAYATVFDITSSENYMTTITADGLYTGKISANQINVDSALVVGGSTYNGSISVRNASNSVMVTLDRTGITAIGGKIGGWTINSSQIYSGSVIFNSNGNIQNGTKWQFNNDGSGRVANGNINWDSAGKLTVTGTVNASTGQIGGFTVAQGRIGSTASGTGSTGGELAIYKDLIRVGTSTSYTLLGGNTFPATMGGHMSTARFTNTRSSSYLHNYGIYCDVKGGARNYALWGNAAIVGNACIGITSTYTYFSGNGYVWDFSQSNIFYVYANSYIAVNLPTQSSVATMFGYSTLPTAFAYIFTIIYEYNWANKIRINNVINNNGALINVDMAKGDVLTLMCTMRRGFHYQIINHHA